MADDRFAFFRVGTGYVDFWVHETTHWNIENSRRIAARQLSESMKHLIQKRDAIQNARRAFLNTSSIPSFEEPSDEIQQRLFTATRDFYLTYYSTLSAFSGFLSRFKHVLGEVPHRSNERFLKWLGDKALFSDKTMPYLRESREFRTVLDHIASFQPYDWSTISLGEPVSVYLHGPCNRSGANPPGANPVSEFPQLRGVLPDDVDWVFPAPDEDKVLTSLAVQMNALFPLIGPNVTDVGVMKECTWNPAHGEGEPRQGYPIYAAAGGLVLTARGDSKATPPSEPGAAFGL